MYVQIPTRTTLDPNAFTDINQLQDNFDALLDGSKSFESITFDNTTGTAGLYATGGILKYQGATIATGGGGGGPAGVPFSAPLSAVVGTAISEIVWPGPTVTIDRVIAKVKVAPTGTTMKFDVNINGVTIFTDQSKRPIIARGGLTADSATPDVVTLSEDDTLSWDQDQIGSTVAGGNSTMLSVKFTQ